MAEIDSVSDPAAWLDANGVPCTRYRATISRRACTRHQRELPEACSGCAFCDTDLSPLPPIDRSHVRMGVTLPPKEQTEMAKPCTRCETGPPFARGLCYRCLLERLDELEAGNGESTALNPGSSDLGISVELRCVETFELRCGTAAIAGLEVMEVIPVQTGTLTLYAVGAEQLLCHGENQLIWATAGIRAALGLIEEKTAEERLDG